MNHGETGRTLAEWAPRLKWRSPRPSLPTVFFMTDRVRQPKPEAIIERLPRGAGVVLRDYGLTDRVGLARRLARLCRSRGLLFLVAGDARLALTVRADGLHLPEHRLRGRPPPRKPTWIVTAAVHSYPAILLAHRCGVDAVFASPVFATRSHEHATPLGPRRLAAWVNAAPVPVYALGGITARTARRLRTLPLAGLAGIGGFPAGGCRDKDAARACCV